MVGSGLQKRFAAIAEAAGRLPVRISMIDKKAVGLHELRECSSPVCVTALKAVVRMR